MEIANLKANSRSELGRSKVARVRAEMQIPAVVYGMGGDNIPVSVPGAEFTDKVFKHHKLFRLDIDGKGENVFLKDLQIDHLDDCILHADFLRLDLDKPMQALVPIEFIGTAKGSATGIFESTMNEVAVECLPTALPEGVRVVINALEVGDHLFVKDITMPEGVKALAEETELVCQVRAKVEQVEPDEAEEGDAEGEDSGEAAGESSSEGES